MVPQNDTVLDNLYCQEQTFEDIGPDCCSFDEEETENDNIPRKITSNTHYLKHDIFWEKTELDTLLLKEKRTHLSYINVTNNGYLIEERKVAVGWILSVVEYYKFSSLTAVLAVNYFDRFTLSHRLERDNDNNCSVNCNNRNNPWMSQLVAVACLSIAAKVDEIKVPLLLDLQQVEESKYVFEAKTIQRMELLVLSTLGWRMYPTTPIDFFDHIARRLGLSIPLHWEFIKSCECLLVSLIADIRLVGCLPSVLATAVMLYVIKEVIKPHNSLEYQEQIMGLLEPSEIKLEECYKLIMELSGNNFRNLDCHVKRKLMSVPGSPSGVIDAYFNRDSSNDSWPAALSSSFSERLPKRSKVQVQPMRLPLLNRVSVDVLSSPD